MPRRKKTFPEKKGDFRSLWRGAITGVHLPEGKPIRITKGEQERKEGGKAQRPRRRHLNRNKANSITKKKLACVKSAKKRVLISPSKPKRNGVGLSAEESVRQRKKKSRTSMSLKIHSTILFKKNETPVGKTYVFPAERQILRRGKTSRYGEKRGGRLRNERGESNLGAARSMVEPRKESWLAYSRGKRPLRGKKKILTKQGKKRFSA